MSRPRSGTARDPCWREGRYTAAHVAERRRRLTIKHLLTCPRCHKSVALVPDRLLVLDHADDEPTRYLDGLAHLRCNARAAAVNTNAKRSGRRPHTRATARVLVTRAAGSTQHW